MLPRAHARARDRIKFSWTTSSTRAPQEEGLVARSGVGATGGWRCSVVGKVPEKRGGRWLLGMKSQVRNQYVTCSPSSSPGLWRRKRRSNLFDLSRLSSHRCLLATCTHLPQLPHPPHHVFTSGSSSGCVSSVMEHVGWWWWWFSHDSCGKARCIDCERSSPVLLPCALSTSRTQTWTRARQPAPAHPLWAATGIESSARHLGHVTDTTCAPD